MGQDNANWKIIVASLMQNLRQASTAAREGEGLTPDQRQKLHGELMGMTDRLKTIMEILGLHTI